MRIRIETDEETVEAEAEEFSDLMKLVFLGKSDLIDQYSDIDYENNLEDADIDITAFQ